MAASIGRLGARVDGMASICELSINVVMNNRPKDAVRPKPNGNAAGTGAVISPVMGKGCRDSGCYSTLPADRESLNRIPVYRAEHGKPVSPLDRAIRKGKADRKEGRTRCG